MLLFQVPDHVGEVISGGGEPLLGSSLGDAPDAVGGEVGEVPAGDEPPEGADPRMLCELAEGVHRQHLGGVELLLNPLFRFVGHLPADDSPLAVLEVQEPEGLPLPPPPPLEPLLGHYRPCEPLVDG